MAAENVFVQNVEELTTCAICLYLFSEPLQLPCLHVFCRECIKTLAKRGDRAGDRGDIFHCPSCRAEVSREMTLPKAFFHNSLAEAVKRFQKVSDGKNECGYCEHRFDSKADGNNDDAQRWLCEDCLEIMCVRCKKQHTKTLANHRLRNAEEITEDEMKKLAVRNRRNTCPNHGGKVIEYLCETCNQLLCVSCAVVEHQQCTKVELVKAVCRYKKRLEKKLQWDELNLKQQKSQLRRIQKDKATMKVKFRNQKTLIRERVDRLKRLATEFGDDLLKEVSDKESNLVSVYDSFAGVLSVSLSNMESEMTLSRFLLERGSPEDVLLRYLEYENTAADLSSDESTFYEERRKLLSEFIYADLQYESRHITYLRKMIGVTSTSCGSPSVQLLHKTDIGFICSGMTKANNGSVVLCELKGKSLAYLDTSTYEIKTVQMQTEDSVEAFDICAFNDHLYVTDPKFAKVRVLDLEGVLVSSITIHSGSSDKIGIDIYNSRMYLSNHSKGVIEKTLLSEEGDYTEGSSRYVKLPGAHYVSVNSSRILVSTCEERHLAVLDRKSHNSVKSIKFNSNESNIQIPSGVCFDRYGHILVADTKNNTIHVYREFHLFMRKDIPLHMYGFSQPLALCFDCNDNLVVTGNDKHLLVLKYEFK